MTSSSFNRLKLDRPAFDAGIENARSKAAVLLKSLAQLGDTRYHGFGFYLRKRFGCRVYKVTLHGGFTCPNRDGRVGFGGCTYCINESFSPNDTERRIPIAEQMLRGIEFYRRRYKAQKYIAYFQTFTNTYADVETLKRRYDEALSVSDDIVGISIGTRPDCVPEEALDLVESYSDRYEVWLEYGLQSIHDKTLGRVNRGHGLAAYMDAVDRTRKRNIRVCVHVILGLPDENWADMMETAKFISKFDGLDSLKVHHLYVAENTSLAQHYADGLIQVLALEDYVPLLCDFLERIAPEISLQRLLGDTTSKLLIAPVWNVGKAAVLRMISDEFRRRGTCQGARCTGLAESGVHYSNGRTLVDDSVERSEYSI